MDGTLRPDSRFWKQRAEIALTLSYHGGSVRDARGNGLITVRDGSPSTRLH